MRPARKLFLLLFGLMAAVSPALGQGTGVAFLAEDLNPEADERSASNGSNPSELFAFGGRYFFWADTGTNGREPWVTEGDPFSTRLFLDVCIGACSSSPPLATTSSYFFFAAELAHRGTSLLRGVWRSDGTREGTTRLTVLETTAVETTHPMKAAVLGDLVVFSDGERHLWVTNGTPSGTSRLAEIENIQSLTPHGDRVAVLTSFGLWLTAGTPETTAQVAQGRFEDFAGNPTSSGGALFFAARDAEAPLPGRELWALPDSGGPPVRLTDPHELRVFSMTSERPGVLLFNACTTDDRCELWETEDASGTLRQLTDFPLPEALRYANVRKGLHRDGGTLWVVVLEDRGEGPRTLWRIESSGSAERVFPTDDLFGRSLISSEVHRLNGRFLLEDFFERHWLSDGVPGSDRPFEDVCGPLDGGFCFSLGVFEDRFLGLEVDGSDNLRYFLSDGTREGTVPILTFPWKYSPSTVSLPQQLQRLPEGWIFRASDGGYGDELWISDGTPKGTRLLVDANPRRNSSSAPEGLVEAGDDLLFRAALPSGTGSSPASVFLKPAPEAAAVHLGESPPGFVGDLLPVPTGVFGTSSNVLWKLSRGSTGAVADVIDDGLSGAPALLGDDVYYPKSSRGLWRAGSDGSPPTQVFDPPCCSRSWRDASLRVHGDRLYLLIREQGLQVRLWASDGTADGTTSLGLLASGVTEPSFFDDLLESRGSLYANICLAGRVLLYRVSPSPDPVAVVGACRSFSVATRSPAKIASNDDRMLVLSRSEEGFRDQRLEVWASDGTLEGSLKLLERREALPSVAGSSPRPQQTLAAYDGAFFFGFPHGDLGEELWVSDGTAAGTRLAFDLWPGGGSSDPAELTVTSAGLFFTANDGTHGRELWVIDGASARPRLVHDIRPGARSSDPKELTVAGERLYFSADDGLSGRELWVLPLGGGPVCRASEEALCLQGDRFLVEARWRDFRGREGIGTAVELTGDTGYFWFFGEENVEAVLKVLDGRGNNDHFWTFFGALSNVEYWLTVTDTRSGLTRRYFNPRGIFGSVGDTFSFGPRGASLEAVPVEQPAPAGEGSRVLRSSAEPGTFAGSCAPSSERLCLNGGRFAVEVIWADFRGGAGPGKAVELTDDTGYFWFFRDTNVELIIKLLDGTANNGHHWVFYGSLSNVDFDLTVTDTVTQEVRTYRNRGREFASVGDTRAFPEG